MRSNFLIISKLTTLDELLILTDFFFPFYYNNFTNYSIIISKIALEKIFWLSINFVILRLNNLLEFFNFKINNKIIRVFLKKVVLHSFLGLVYIFDYEIKDLNEKIKNLNKKIEKLNSVVNLFNDFIFIATF